MVRPVRRPYLFPMTETPSAVEELTGRLFMEGLGAAHMFTLYLGVHLGLFAALATEPGLTAAKLAAATGTDPRYAAEWAQAECAAGLLVTDNGDPKTGRLTLADGVTDVLVDEVNPAYLGGLPRAVAAVGAATASLVEAYRTGAGVPLSAYGPEVVTAQAQLNRPGYIHELAQSWIPAMPDVEARLRDTAHPARVADIGCGVGWASIELAKAFPGARIDGLDADPESIDQARVNAKEHGVDGRVEFRVIDGASGYGDAEYDVVFFFECLHDFGRPVEGLAAARRAVRPGGAVIVMDERTADAPQVGDPVESFFAGFSALWCLPQSMTVPDCEAPGTIMRQSTLGDFARRAGWTGYDVVPIEHPMFRFYRLT